MLASRSRTGVSVWPGMGSPFFAKRAVVNAATTSTLRRRPPEAGRATRFTQVNSIVQRPLASARRARLPAQRHPSGSWRRACGTAHACATGSCWARRRAAHRSRGSRDRRPGAEGPRARRCSVGQATLRCRRGPLRSRVLFGVVGETGSRPLSVSSSSAIRAARRVAAASSSRPRSVRTLARSISSQAWGTVAISSLK